MLPPCPVEQQVCTSHSDSGGAWGRRVPLASSLLPSRPGWDSCPQPTPSGLERPEPLKYTKLGGPKSWKLRKPRFGSQGLRLWEAVWGRPPPPINICNPPTCSLLPKLLPKCLFQAPESACGTGGVVGGPWFLRVFIIQVYICKKIFFKYMCLFTTSQAVCSSGLQGK